MSLVVDERQQTERSIPCITDHSFLPVIILSELTNLVVIFENMEIIDVGG